MRILVIHGPNLNLLGERETDMYGTTDLATIDAALKAMAKKEGADVECVQSNNEGEIVEREVRVGVVLVGHPMCRPAGVRDAEHGTNGIGIERILQLAHLSDGTHAGQSVVVVHDGDARRVVAPVFEPAQALHDENHAQTGGEYLASLGFPEVGHIVRQHVMLDCYFEADVPDEAEVINYADKRVLHDRIVPLDHRMTYILQRYAKTKDRQELLKKLWDQTRALEKRLFAYLNFHPDNIPATLLASVMPI